MMNVHDPDRLVASLDFGKAHKIRDVRARLSVREAEIGTGTMVRHEPFTHLSSSSGQECDAKRSDGGLVARTLPAIDVNGLARHEARRLQIEDRAYDVRDLTHPAKRMQLGKLRMCFDGMHRRLDDPGRNRIHSDAELGILDRQ